MVPVKASVRQPQPATTVLQAVWCCTAYAACAACFDAKPRVLHPQHYCYSMWQLVSPCCCLYFLLLVYTGPDAKLVGSNE
jgi:hypothetical protein